jgi:hypothetical protein
MCAKKYDRVIPVKTEVRTGKELEKKNLLALCLAILVLDQEDVMVDYPPARYKLGEQFHPNIFHLYVGDYWSVKIDVQGSEIAYTITSLKHSTRDRTGTISILQREGQLVVEKKENDDWRPKSIQQRLFVLQGNVCIQLIPHESSGMHNTIVEMKGLQYLRDNHQPFFQLTESFDFKTSFQ